MRLRTAVLVLIVAMTWPHTAMLLIASIGAGAMKALAGGGTFLILPVLVLSGVDPVSATATCTVALWPSDIVSAYAYRRELAGLRARVPVVRLCVASIAGGSLGALLLLRIPRSSFQHLAPYLLLVAAVIFTNGDTLARRIRARRSDDPAGHAAWLVAVGQLVLAIYGGVFGAGLGILMLALFSLLGLRDIHQMNALKNLLGVMLNGLASGVFLITSTVAWKPAAVMVIGTTLGGYSSAILSRRLNPRHVRYLVIAISWGMTGYYFLNHYLTNA